MPTIKVYDKEGEFFEADVDDGMDLMDACEEAGLILSRSCGRGGWCSTCAVTVEKGTIAYDGDLTPMGPEELETMDREGIDPETQVLSCSCQIFGDVTVREIGEG